MKIWSLIHPDSSTKWIQNSCKQYLILAGVGGKAEVITGVAKILLTVLVFLASCSV